MRSPRNRKLPTLTGMAVSSLALAGLAVVPGPAAAAPAATTASVSSAASTASVSSTATAASTAAAPASTRVVRTERQLRRAVRAANQADGRVVIRVARNIRFSRDRPTSGGALRGDLDVSGDVMIRGAGRNLNARRVDRAFDVRPGGRLVVQGLTVRHGRAPQGQSGGGIRVTDATLVLRRSGVVASRVTGEGASGGAIFNDGGTVRVHASRLAENAATRAGGALEADGGSTTFNRSRIVRNTTGSGPGNGGGVHLTGEGEVEVVRTCVARNTAAAEGGGLWNSSTGTFLVRGSNLVRNRAAGAEADNGGGGLFNDGGELTVRNSSLDANRATGTSGSGGGILSAGGDLVVEQAMLTQNSASRAGGGIEVVDGTTTVWLSTLEDNRTASNPGNGGALHVTAETAEVTVARSVVTGNSASAEGGGLWNGGGRMEVTGTVFSENTAAGAEATNGGGALFNNGGTMLVTGGTLEGNAATGAAGSGGAILNDQGSLTVRRADLIGNQAPRAGGAIEANLGETTVRGSTLAENSTGAAPGNGGALHLTGAGTVLVAGTDVTENTAANEGGGLWSSADGEFTVRGSEVVGNTASGADADAGGGGVYNDGGELSIEGSTIQSNVADGASGSGGGVLNVAGNLEISGTTLEQNTSVRAGGGIETSAGTVTLTDVDALANSTGANPGNGGGLHITEDAEVEWTGGQVSGNTAENEGGGVWNSAVGVLTLVGVSVEDNQAPTGPDVFTVEGGTTTEDGTPVTVR